ncbi:uncharacterized protein LOC124146559 isoform X2 [Haliotis rufescens]|nr:uncharacterized protein LOC124146559 isoform X2 [Haliotis rufescens]
MSRVTMLRVLVLMLMAVEICAATSDVCSTTSATLIAHPTKCAQYYNCSAPGLKINRYILGPHLQECPFPQLYNPETQRCEHYSMVKCGKRTEPLGMCEYAKHACFGGRYCGPPCHVYSPTCRNLSDGLNVYEYRLNSPHYVVCVNQRLVYTGVCHNYGTGPNIFDSKLRACRCS